MLEGEFLSFVLLLFKQCVVEPSQRTGFVDI